MSLMLALGVLALDRSVGGTATRPALLGVSLAMPFILLFWLCRKAAYLKFEPTRAVQGAVTYCATALGLLLLLRRLEWLSPFSTFLLLGCASLVASAVITISLGLNLARGWRTIGVDEYYRSGNTGSTDAGLIMGTVVYWLSGGAYYVVVGGLLGMKEAAALRALQNFVLPVTQFMTAIGVLLLPWLSGRYARTDTSSFKRIIRAVNLLFVASAMAYVAALPLWRDDGCSIWLYKGKYSQFAYLLPLVTLPMLLSAASQGTAMALRVMQAPADVFWGYAGGGAVTLVAGVVLTHAWGLAGALAGLSASSLLFFAIVTVLYRRRLRRWLRMLPMTDEQGNANSASRCSCRLWPGDTTGSQSCVSSPDAFPGL